MSKCNGIRPSVLLVLCAVFHLGVLLRKLLFTPAAIQVPDGFVVEVAAAPPLVKHPMMAAFDDRGRLFIAKALARTCDAPTSKRNCQTSSA